LSSADLSGQIGFDALSLLRRAADRHLRKTSVPLGLGSASPPLRSRYRPDPRKPDRSGSLLTRQRHCLGFRPCCGSRKLVPLRVPTVVLYAGSSTGETRTSNASALDSPRYQAKASSPKLLNPSAFGGTSVLGLTTQSLLTSLAGPSSQRQGGAALRPSPSEPSLRLIVFQRTHKEHCSLHSGRQA